MKLIKQIIVLLISMSWINAHAIETNILGIWEGTLSAEIDERNVFDGKDIPIKINIIESEIQIALLIKDTWTGITPLKTSYSGNDKTISAYIPNLMDDWSEIYSINVHFLSSNNAIIYMMKTSHNYNLKENDQWKVWRFIAQGKLHRK